MDESQLLKHLALAERHVLESEGRISRQRALVDELERDGHDSGAARRLLLEFERSLALHRYDLARINAELMQAHQPAADLLRESGVDSPSDLHFSVKRDRI